MKSLKQNLNSKMRLRLDNEVVYIEDLKSFNGTTINGQALEVRKEYPLNNGDDLVIGAVTGKIHFLKEGKERIK